MKQAKRYIKDMIINSSLDIDEVYSEFVQAYESVYNDVELEEIWEAALEEVEELNT
jgi:hypothetical protein